MLFSSNCTYETHTLIWIHGDFNADVYIGPSQTYRVATIVSRSRSACKTPKNLILSVVVE